MKNLLNLFFALAVLILTNSCKTDFELNEIYKESVAVYGLLDQSDSVNYIRVNRVFLGAGDATAIAQSQDSAYFKPGEITVSVEKYFNGVKKQTFLFYETYEKPLNAGPFNVNQLIYKSVQPFRADSANTFFDYKLVVKNNKTGTEFKSNTRMIREHNSSNQCNGVSNFCFFQFTTIGIPYPGTMRVKVGSPANARACGFKMRFHYRDSLAGNVFVPRYVDIPFSNKKTGSLSGGQEMDFSFAGEVFYSTIGAAIKDDPNVLSRRADSVNFYFSFAGEELNLYNEINGTAGAFGQEKPIYTNIDNGAVGVFSSRYTHKVVRPFYNCLGAVSQPNTINYQTLDLLATSNHTCHLHFQKSNCAINVFCQ